MPNYTVTDPATNKSITLTGDSPPTEQELNDIFSKINLTKEEKKQETQNDVIAQRPSAIADLIKNPTTFQHPVGAVLRTLGGANELYQGVPASIALDLQHGKPQNIIPNLGKVITGQRPAQYGDVFQGAGVPKPLAAAGGLYTDFALAPGGADLMKGVSELATKGVGKAIQNVGKFMDFDQRALDLGQRVRSTASAAKKAEVDKFGSKLDELTINNPNKTVSLQDVVAGIQKDIPDMSPEAQAVFRKVPKLKDMIKDPSQEGYIDPSSVPLKDTQEIINYINTKVPRNIKYNHLDIVDANHNIRAAQLQAFPEMKKIRESYGKFAEDYKLIKSALNPKATPNAIMSNFSNNIAVKDAAKRVLAPLIKDMIKLRGQKATVEWTKKLGLGAIGAEVVYATAMKMMGKK